MEELEGIHCDKAKVGAFTGEEQLQRWLAGAPECPNNVGECCPDFSCCNPKLLWPVEKRQKYIEAGQEEREKFLLSSLGSVLSEAEVKGYVTRGNPTDHS
jgi:hypothetical protein